VKRLFLVIALTLPPAFAFAQAWTIDTLNDKSAMFAATINDSGLVLAQVCYIESANCLWAITTKSRCVSGAEYPALVNGTTGAIPVTMKCDGPAGADGGYRYFFMDFESVDRTLRSSTQIGVAMPLEGDQFRVTRFNLLGMISSLDRMRESVLRIRTIKPKSTRDTVL